MLATDKYANVQHDLSDTPFPNGDVALILVHASATTQTHCKILTQWAWLEMYLNVLQD